MTFHTTHTHKLTSVHIKVHKGKDIDTHSLPINAISQLVYEKVRKVRGKSDGGLGKEGWIRKEKERGGKRKVGDRKTANDGGLMLPGDIFSEAMTHFPNSIYTLTPEVNIMGYQYMDTPVQILLCTFGLWLFFFVWASLLEHSIIFLTIMYFPLCGNSLMKALF